MAYIYIIILLSNDAKKMTVHIFIKKNISKLAKKLNIFKILPK